MRLAALGTFAVLAALVGCSSAPQVHPWPGDSPARWHVIAVDELGRSIDPDDPGRNFDHIQTVEQYSRQLAEINSAMNEWTSSHTKDGYKQVLIFVHGGMVEPIDALNRSADQAQEIMRAGYWPIFIVWNSDLGSSYGEHLTHIRNGFYESDSTWAAPVYALSDTGRAIARWPIVWGNQVNHDVHRIGAALDALSTNNPERWFVSNPELLVCAEATKVLIDASADHPDSNIHLSMGRIQGAPINLAEAAFFGLMLPVKFLVSPQLDSIGSAAWENMYRRALILFDGFSVNRIGSSTDVAEIKSMVLGHGDGALERLIQLFNSTDRASRSRPTTQKDPSVGHHPYRITLVGHSMGSIVLNEFLRRSEEVDYDNVVYMAAACSVRDMQRSVIPYMEHHPRTNFYNLCLHPVNDLREIEGCEVPPRGSLLVWIDDMFGNPRTPLDRTLGRWDNIVRAAFVVPNRLRPRVWLKSFDLYVNANPPADPTTQPQKHGDFSRAPYWSPDFWKPLEPADASQAIAPVIRQTHPRMQQMSLKRKAPTTQQAVPSTQGQAQ